MPSLSPELAAILACPTCKQKVEIREDLGEIRCSHCQVAYPIREGIPVMLVDESHPIPKR